ncbi:MAG: class I SAM-dependent methyltransferase [Geothrix sp.]|nr:class I SAM-dependent methyltransferase [Geothrix sp.]
MHPSFEGKVLGHIAVNYHRCETCASLILPSPHWLEEAYSKTIIPDPDQGSLNRSMFVHRCIRRLRATRVRLLPRQFRSLDVGCGKGLLLRLLLDEGMDAWAYDPYPKSIYAEDRILSEFPSGGGFDLVTLIEVLEHTLDPVDTLARFRTSLAPSGLILASTELFDESIHGKNWHYLAPEHGQHITLFSRQGLQIACDKAGLDWLETLSWGKVPFLHILAPKGTPISPWAAWLLKRRHRLGESRFCKDRRV